MVMVGGGAGIPVGFGFVTQCGAAVFANVTRCFDPSEPEGARHFLLWQLSDSLGCYSAYCTAIANLTAPAPAPTHA